MAYQFTYVFFATPFDSDAELKTFHEVIASFNEDQAMPAGYLFTSLIIVSGLADKRPMQGAVSENIRMCSYYLQVIEDTWGPPQRDYERDWALAQTCLDDPSMPMKEAVMLFKAPLLPHKVDPAIIELKKTLPDAPTFETPQQLGELLKPMFTRWLGSETCPS